MNALNLRTLVLSIGTAVALFAAAGPARADDDHWRHDHDQRARWEHEHHERYVPPPVVVVAPPPRVVYQPPPVVVAPPPSGLNIVLPIHFN